MPSSTKGPSRYEPGDLREAAEAEEAGAATSEEELESTILAEMEKRGRLPSLSTFAFTVTPKPKTLAPHPAAAAGRGPGT